MLNSAYYSVTRYFNHLANVGYMRQRDVERLLVYLSIQELLDNDFRGFVSESDYTLINRALYCLYGSTCLIPYPDYYNCKNKKVMYLGSVSEIAHLIESFEKDIIEIKRDNERIKSDIVEIKEADIVVPGDEHADYDDSRIDLS